jgi:hypothetical protein
MARYIMGHVIIAGYSLLTFLIGVLSLAGSVALFSGEQNWRTMAAILVLGVWVVICFITSFTLSAYFSSSPVYMIIWSSVYIAGYVARSFGVDLFYSWEALSCWIPLTTSAEKACHLPVTNPELVSNWVLGLAIAGLILFAGNRAVLGLLEKNNELEVTLSTPKS